MYNDKQAKELKGLLLRTFEYTDVSVRECETHAAYEVEIRIIDMAFIDSQWHEVTATHKISQADTFQPGAIIGQLAYLLDREKSAVQS